MSVINAEELRAQLTSEEARAAFDLVNKVKPNWLVSHFEEKVCVGVTIGTTTIGKDTKGAVKDGGLTHGLNETVINLAGNFMQEAETEDRLLIVKGPHGNCIMQHNPETGEFTPYIPE